jgi:integrase
MASIQKRPNGRWRARYRDPVGAEHARHFERKTDAQRWLDEVTADLVVGHYVDPRAGSISLDAYYRRWAERQIWASGTVKAMDLAMRDCSFARVELRALRRSHAEAWVKAMTRRGLAPGTIKTRVNNVRSVLRGAIGDRLLTTDPLTGVTLPRVRRAEHAMTIPSIEEVGALLATADLTFRPFVALCAFAGLRLGEASAVQLPDVDFLRRVLHVRRQVQRAGGGEIEVTPPKYGSERDVAIPDELAVMLSEHVRVHGVRGDEAWLFVGDRGNPPHQNTVGYWWRKTLRDAGVTGIRLHDLRHFYASGLIAAGCDVVTVQRALGHAKPTTTLNTYAHLWPTAEDRTRAAASDLMHEAFEAAAADRLRTARG